MEVSRIITVLAKYKWLIVALLVVLAVVFALSRYSFITVEVTGGQDSAEFRYQLLKQGDQEATELSSSEPTITKLVPKANYEILVTQDDQTAFATIKTGGWFTKITVQVSLESENGVQFVGNNPKACMHYGTGKLYSYDCDGAFRDAQIHVPAFASQPTYVLPNSSGREGTVEGIISTAEGSIALIQSRVGNHPSVHTAYVLVDNLKTGRGTILDELDPGQSYSMKPYREGFIVYDDSFNKILYYSSLKAPAQEIAVGKPDDSSLVPHLISSYGSTVMGTYSTAVDNEAAEIDIPEVAERDKTEALLYQDGDVKNLTLNRPLSSAQLCGNKRLCLTHNKIVSIYDITGEKPRELFSVSGVNQVESAATGLLLVRDKEILNVDTDTGKGFVEYSLGDYQFCGIQASKDSYLICLINNKNNRVAVRVDQKAGASDDIDQKINDLLKLAEIRDISIYGRYIFISPNVGITYNPATDGFGFNPQAKRQADEKINNEIDSLGINKSSYQIKIN